MLGFRPRSARRLSSVSRGEAATGLFLFASGVFLLVVAANPRPLGAAGPDDCRRQLIAGQYDQCIAAAEKAIHNREYGEVWHVLKASSELAQGKYPAARASVERGLERYSWSVQLRLVGRDAYLHTGDADAAARMLAEIDQLAGRTPWRFTDADDLVALGQAALLMGADARDVLDSFFERARRERPQHRAGHLASGQLALDKNDFPLAAEIFHEALGRFPDDPDLLFGLAQASADSDPRQSAVLLDRALEHNPSHVAALLHRVDDQIDSERYDEAGRWIERALAVNPAHPHAWAYRALIAHLTNDPKGADVHRAAALGTWRTNPSVDSLIGRKLAQKYRFAEAVALQRQALSFDANYLPARIQLAQALLRLGDEEAGWQSADEAHAADGYDVATFNLLELRDELAKFTTLADEHFILRMESREAAIYGQRVLDLLHRAKRTLCKKYGLDLAHPVTVEIFPDQNDFAVRTFGMPAVSGFLGVCFGRVITANSPASQVEHPSNWEAVLWHEFCHVVTLELTRNRIPRWLSEGISVYEELQADPAWGQQMNPRYREMVLAGELTPLGRLSAAFLAPKTSLHLQFAYYESALAVEFLVDTFGLDALKLVLRDLGAGLPINTVLERHTVPLPQLEADFEAFVRERAEQLAPRVDWERHDLASLINDDTDRFDRWIADHPNHFAGQMLYASRLLEEQKWEEAKAPLERLIDLYPEYNGADNAYEQLARVHRELNDADAERAVLRRYAALDADALGVYLRLLELEQAAGDWEAVLQTARRVLAVNPLIPQPHRAIAAAAEQLVRTDGTPLDPPLERGELIAAAERLGRTDDAIAACRTLLLMQPDDPAETHYRLARLLHQKREPAAKRHLLAALEEAPRFRAAHKLLLEITRAEESLGRVEE